LTRHTKTLETPDKCITLAIHSTAAPIYSFSVITLGISKLSYFHSEHVFLFGQTGCNHKRFQNFLSIIREVCSEVVPVPKHSSEMCGGVEVKLQVFLTSALHVGKWSVSRFGRFTPKKKPPEPHWTGDWVSLGVDLGALARRKIRIPAGNTTPVIELIASHFTDWAFRLGRLY